MDIQTYELPSNMIWIGNFLQDDFWFFLEVIIYIVGWYKMKGTDGGL